MEKNIERQDNFRRGQIYIASLGREVIGSEQAGKRPVLIIQNDIGNKYSSTMVVAMISTKIPRKKQRTHVLLKKDDYEGLDKDCVIMTEQIKTISKERIQIPIPIDTLKREDIKRLDATLLLSIGITR